MRIKDLDHLHRSCPAASDRRHPRVGGSSVQVQFPYDIDNRPTGNFPGPEDVDWNMDGFFSAPTPTVKYMRLGGTDGYSRMADGLDLYTFGFVDLTGVPETISLPSITTDIMQEGFNHANFPAPTIVMNEGDEFYLNVSNIGMKLRPDLFDPHTVHFHGFPNAASVFDGEPMASFGIRMNATVHLLLPSRGPGHLHVPLPCRGHGAHGDGHARQSRCEAKAERDDLQLQRKKLHPIRV